MLGVVATGTSKTPGAPKPRPKSLSTLDRLKPTQEDIEVERADDSEGILADELKTIVNEELRRQLITSPSANEERHEMVVHEEPTEDVPQEITSMDPGEDLTSHPLTNPWYSQSKGDVLNKEEREKVLLVGRLHTCLAHASKAQMVHAIKHGTFLNCNLTVKDIDHYYDVKPPCIGCLTAIQPIPTSKPNPIPSGALKGQYWEMDIFFISGAPYLLLVECITKYLYVRRLASRMAGAVAKEAKIWEAHIKKNFHRAVETKNIWIRCDREKVFKAFEESIQGVHLSRTPAEGHANRAEAHIKKVKNRTRATKCHIEKTHGYEVPLDLEERLVEHVVDCLNRMPGTLQVTESAYEAVFGVKPKLDDFLKCEFGQMGYTVIPKDQRREGKDGAQGVACIIVGCERKTPTNLICYNPMTKKTITRGKFTAVPQILKSC